MTTDITKTETGLKHLSQKSYLKVSVAKDISQAVNSTDYTLSQIKAISPVKTIEVIIELIRETAKLCNKNPERTINNDQAIELANFILQRYWFLKIAEIRYCFRQGYTNQYKTKIFDSLEFNHFTDWLEEYDMDRVFYIQTEKYKVDHNVKALPEFIDETNIKQINETIENLVRRNYNLNKRLQEEKDKVFINLFEYYKYYNMPDHETTMKVINEAIEKQWENNPTVNNKFLNDKDVYSKHIHFKVLAMVNQYKPKDQETIFRYIKEAVLNS